MASTVIFSDVVKAQLAICIPCKDVVEGPKHPVFVTPFVKSLLSEIGCDGEAEFERLTSLPQG
jgi:hypothetical protein